MQGNWSDVGLFTFSKPNSEAAAPERIMYVSTCSQLYRHDDIDIDIAYRGRLKATLIQPPTVSAIIVTKALVFDGTFRLFDICLSY